MDVFEAVRDSITAREAAEMYGIKVNRNGMACCPFHDDKYPSMSLRKRYHCFGCQADGDAISFVARYFDLRPIEAAHKLAEDFGISYDNRVQFPAKLRPRPKISAELEAKKKEAKCCRILSEYLHLMEKWESDFAPKSPEEDSHPLFVEALQNKDYVEYLLDDVLLGSDDEDKAAFINKHYNDVETLERRLQGFVADKDNDREQTRCSIAI